jgi:hypothetical protein
MDERDWELKMAKERERERDIKERLKAEEAERDRKRKEEKDRIEEHIKLSNEKKAREERERQDEIKRIKEEAVKEHERKRMEEKEKEEKAEAEYNKRFENDLAKSGLSSHEIQDIVKRKVSKGGDSDEERPTHVKISRRYISIETLRQYGIPHYIPPVSFAFLLSLGQLKLASYLTDLSCYSMIPKLSS